MITLKSKRAARNIEDMLLVPLQDREKVLQLKIEFVRSGGHAERSFIK